MESQLAFDLTAGTATAEPVSPLSDRREQEILRMINDIFDTLASTETTTTGIPMDQHTLLLRRGDVTDKQGR
jgi:hypothetical protein